MGLEGAHRSSTTSMEGLVLIDRWSGGCSIPMAIAAGKKTAFAACRSEYLMVGGGKKSGGCAWQHSATKVLLVEFSSIATRSLP